MKQTCNPITPKRTPSRLGKVRISSALRSVLRRLRYSVIPLFLHSAIVLGISYVITVCFISSAGSLSFFGVLDESGDAPMSDMYLYVNARRGPARLEPRIVFVDIDACKDRFEIAQVIEQVNALRPKVVGLDVFFRNRKDPGEDAKLEKVILKSENLVVACVLASEQQDDNDTYHLRYHNFFADREDLTLTEGFINLDSDGFRAVQTFTPRLFLQLDESLDTIYSFAAQVVRLYDETAFHKLLQRTGNLELIHYQPLLFYEIDKNEIDDNAELITGKIVLIGSLSEEMHKTPVNPQMRGIEIHAFVISTIMDAIYINRIDNVWTKILNTLLCFLFTLFCWFATTRFSKGASILIKLVQVAILGIAFFAGYYLFNLYNIDMTYSRSIIVMGIVILIVDIYNVCIFAGRKFLITLKNKLK